MRALTLASSWAEIAALNTFILGLGVQEIIDYSGLTGASRVTLEKRLRYGGNRKARSAARRLGVKLTRAADALDGSPCPFCSRPRSTDSFCRHACANDECVWETGYAICPTEDIERCSGCKRLASRTLGCIFCTILENGAVTKFLVPEVAPNLHALASHLEGVASWEQNVGSAQAIEESVRTWLAGRGIQMKDVAQAARVALTGSSESPGLFAVMGVLGRNETLHRLRYGAALAERRNS